MAYYLDTSALTKLVTREAETPAFREWFSSNASNVISSEITYVELIRATRRHAPLRIEQAEFIVAGIRLVGMTMMVIREAARFEPVTLRSLDALHLATASSLGSDLDGLVTYDIRLAGAAQGFGINVLAPV